MTNVNGRGDNDEPILWGVSHVDGITPVQIKFDPSTRIMLVDDTTTISFNPATVSNVLVVPSNVKFATATSSSDNTTVRPWVVNATTGAVLIDM